jgi:hypothetical protein
MRSSCQAILHLHGEYRRPESVVLGLASYQKVKDDPHAKAILQCFTLAKTLLFVGCGDTVLDPNDVLQQSVELVAEIWKDNKEALPWLKECAQSDQNEDVLSSAVKMLAYGWKVDPGTQTIRD